VGWEYESSDRPVSRSIVYFRCPASTNLSFETILLSGRELAKLMVGDLSPLTPAGGVKKLLFENNYWNLAISYSTIDKGICEFVKFWSSSATVTFKCCKQSPTFTVDNSLERTHIFGSMKKNQRNADLWVGLRRGRRNKFLLIIILRQKNTDRHRHQRRYTIGCYYFELAVCSRNDYHVMLSRFV